MDCRSGQGVRYFFHMYSQRMDKVAHKASPQRGCVSFGSQDPGFVVGKPCTKQYTSHAWHPSRHSVRSICSHLSLPFLLGCVSSNNRWIPLAKPGLFQSHSIASMRCSPASYLVPSLLCEGCEQIGKSLTGPSCQRSPAKQRFSPPNIRGCRRRDMS